MNKKIYVGIWGPIGILFILLVISFLIPYAYPDFETKTIDYMRDSDGNIFSAPPFSPEEMPPIGSDKIGRNLLYLLLAGAKYTILASIGIAFFRMIFGFIFGLTYAFLPPRLAKILKGLGEALQFIPLVVVVYASLFTLNTAFLNGLLPSTEYFILQMVVIAIVIIPSLGIYIGEEMKLFLKNEFLQASRVMGASKMHIIKKHLLPHYCRRSIVLFSEQISQTLALIIQMGIIYLCLGGLKELNFGIAGTEPEYFSATHEWAAMISMNIQQIFINPWLVVAPLLFFSILIFLVNVISQNLKQLLLDPQVIEIKPKSKTQNTNTETLKIDESSFTYTNPSR